MPPRDKPHPQRPRMLSCHSRWSSRLPQGSNEHGNTCFPHTISNLLRCIQTKNCTLLAACCILNVRYLSRKNKHACPLKHQRLILVAHAWCMLWELVSSENHHTSKGRLATWQAPARPCNRKRPGARPCLSETRCFHTCVNLIPRESREHDTLRFHGCSNRHVAY